MKSITLPVEVAVIKCRAHQKLTTEIDKGNDKADKAAKEAASLPMPSIMSARLAKEQIKLHQYNLSDIIAIQAAATQEDHDKWQTAGGAADDDGLWSNSGKVTTPVEILPWLARMAHLNGHVCKRGTVRQVQESWYAPGIGKIAEGVVKLVRYVNNINNTKKIR